MDLAAAGRMASASLLPGAQTTLARPALDPEAARAAAGGGLGGLDDTFEDQALMEERMAHLRQKQFIKEKNLDDKALQELIRVMEIENWPANKTLFNQGDVGDKFYIILGGRVDVIKDEKVVVTLGAGVAFGELALQNDAPRAAGIRTVDDCEFLTVNRDSYQRIMRLITAKGFSTRPPLDELRKLPVWQTLGLKTDAEITEACRNLLHQRAEKGTVLFRQGQEPNARAGTDRWYVVYRGKVALDVRYAGAGDILIESLAGASRVRSRPATPASGASEVASDDGPQLAMSFVPTATNPGLGLAHRIGVYGKNSTFGQVSLVYPDQRREATATVTEPSELLYLDSTAFHQCGLAALVRRKMDWAFDRLRSFPIFSEWEDANLKAVSDVMRIRSCSPGEWVAREGELAEEVFFVLSGVGARVLKRLVLKWPNHRPPYKPINKPVQVPLGTLSPGEAFAVKRGQLQAGCRAMGDVIVGVLARPHFVHLFDTSTRRKLLEHHIPTPTGDRLRQLWVDHCNARRRIGDEQKTRDLSAQVTRKLELLASMTARRRSHSTPFITEYRPVAPATDRPRHLDREEGHIARHVLSHRMIADDRLLSQSHDPGHPYYQSAFPVPRSQRQYSAEAHLGILEQLLRLLRRTSNVDNARAPSTDPDLDVNRDSFVPPIRLPLLRRSHSARQQRTAHGAEPWVFGGGSGWKWRAESARRASPRVDVGLPRPPADKKPIVPARLRRGASVSLMVDKSRVMPRPPSGPRPHSIRRRSGNH